MSSVTLAPKWRLRQPRRGHRAGHDAIRLGPDAVGLKLAALARLTGGAVHKPEDLGELCAVCEAPTFVAGAEDGRER